jgi:hypothetical protein
MERDGLQIGSCGLPERFVALVGELFFKVSAALLSRSAEV